MSYFIVLGEYGPGRQAGVPLRDQPRWNEHVAFMDGLIEEGLILLGGPFGAGDRVLLVAAAESRQTVVDKLAEDPWRASKTLLAPEIEPWDVLIGDPLAARVR